MSEADWNIALTRKWLLLCSQLDSKHSFAARLTLYAMLQTSSQLQKHSVANGNNSQCFFCALETINNILRGRNLILHSIISQQMINQTTALIVLHTWSSHYSGCWTYSVKVLEVPWKNPKKICFVFVLSLLFDLVCLIQLSAFELWYMWNRSTTPSWMWSEIILILINYECCRSCGWRSEERAELNFHPSICLHVWYGTSGHCCI